MKATIIAIQLAWFAVSPCFSSLAPPRSGADVIRDRRVIINEILYDDPGVDDLNFIELTGPPGTELTGLRVVAINGAQASCTDVYLDIPLDGYAIGPSGYFVLAQSPDVPNFDYISFLFSLDNGPDNVQLVDTTGAVLDSLGYGEFSPSQCDLSEGAAAEDCPAVADMSLSRCPDGMDTQNNSADFRCSVWSPGEPNPNPTPAPVPVRINEIHYDDSGIDTACFIELIGPAGYELSGLAIQGIQGTDPECRSLYVEILLDGYQIGQSGYFTIAQSAEVPGADLVTHQADLTNGPDLVVLRQIPDTIIDVLGYGLGDCPMYETAPAEDCPPSELSLSRCPDGRDTDNNSLDFLCVAQSPGETNSCPTAAPTLPPASPTPAATVTPTPDQTAVPTGTLTLTPTGTSAHTATPTPDQTAVPTATLTPTPTVEATATATATPTLPPTASPPLPTSSPAPTATCPAGLTVGLVIAHTYVSPGDTFYCTAAVCNGGGAVTDVPFCALLDIGVGEYWFYPSWTHYPPGFDFQLHSLPSGERSIEVIAPFRWPDTGGERLAGIRIYAAFLSVSLDALASTLGMAEFSFGPSLP